MSRFSSFPSAPFGARQCGAPPPSRGRVSPRVSPLRQVAGVSFAAAVLLGTGSAQASGYLSARFGGDHGTAANPSPFAVYYNPAALGGLTGTQVTLDGTLVVRTASYERPASALSPLVASTKDDPNYRNANTGTAKLTNVLGLPFVGFGSDLGMKNLRVGAALFVPFGGQAEWARNSAWSGRTDLPGAVDGPQRWVNISGQILAVYGSLAAAYRFEDAHLSVGVSLSGIFHKITTVRARNFDGTDDVKTPSGALKEGRALIEAHGFNMALGLGLYWEPTPEVKVGLSYQSQPGFGTTRMKGTLEQQFGTSSAIAERTDIEFLQAYPDIFRLAGSFRVDKQWELRFGTEFVRWSVLKGQCVINASKSNGSAACDLDDKYNASSSSPVVQNVVRNWKDSVNFAAGVGYFPTDTLELFFGETVSTSPVPKETIDVATIDSTRIYTSVGTRVQVSKSFFVAGSYTNLYFVPVDTEGKSQHFTFGSTSKSPSSDGVYKSMVHLFNVNLTVGF